MLPKGRLVAEATYLRPPKRTAVRRLGSVIQSSAHRFPSSFIRVNLPTGHLADSVVAKKIPLSRPSTLPLKLNFPP